MDEPVIKARNSENTSEETIYVPASKVIQNLGYGYESTATSLNVTDIISYYKNQSRHGMKTATLMRLTVLFALKILTIKI